MRGLSILHATIQEMKNVQKIIVPALKGVFAKNIACAIMFCANITLKGAIVNPNVRKNHALVMLMIENAIKIFVKVSNLN